MPEVLDVYDQVDKKPFVPNQEPEQGYAEDTIPREKMSVLRIVFDVLERFLPPDQAGTIRDAIVKQFVKK